MKRFVFLTYLYLHVLLLTISCTKHDSGVFRIGTNIWPGYEPLYLAQDRGFFQKNNIRMIEYSSATETIRAFRNKSIEAAALTLDEVLLLAQDGAMPVVVLVADQSNGGDAIVSRKKLKHLKELKGLKIGVEDSALGGYMLSRALDLAGLKSSDVNVVSLEISKQEEAYKDKIVDAVVTFDPVKSNLINAGAHLAFDSTQIPGEIADVLVVHKEVLQHRPDVIHNVKSSWYKAIELLNASPNESIEFMAKRERVSPEEFKKSLAGIVIPSEIENKKLVEGSDPQLRLAADRLQLFMYEKGLLKNKVDTKKLFYSEQVK